MIEKKIEISLPLGLDNYMIIKEHINKKNVEIDPDIIKAFLDYDAKLNSNINPDEYENFTFEQISQIPRLVFMMIETLILLDTTHSEKTRTSRRNFAIQCFTELSAVEFHKDYYAQCEGGISEYLNYYKDQQREQLKKYIDAVHSPTDTLKKLKSSVRPKLKLIKISR